MFSAGDMQDIHKYLAERRSDSNLRVMLHHIFSHLHIIQESKSVMGWTSQIRQNIDGRTRKKIFNTLLANAGRRSFTKVREDKIWGERSTVGWCLEKLEDVGCIDLRAKHHRSIYFTLLTPVTSSMPFLVSRWVSGTEGDPQADQIGVSQQFESCSYKLDGDYIYSHHSFYGSRSSPRVSSLSAMQTEIAVPQAQPK